MSSDPKVVTERAIGVGALVLAVIAPVLFNAYWLDVILTQSPDRRHRRRQPHLPRGVRRHDLAGPDDADG